VGLGDDGAFDVFAYTSIHFVVDITGYYAPPGAANGLYYHPLPQPVRVLDTRAGQPGPAGCDRPSQSLAGQAYRTETAAVVACANDANGALQYYALSSPVRLLDTRSGLPAQSACDQPGTPLAANQDALEQAAPRTCSGQQLPGAARAIVGNGTVVNGGAGGGYVTLYPSTTGRPNASNLNYRPGRNAAIAFTVG